MNYDFCGWVTKNDLECSDGRTIRHNAFKDNDGNVVPLVWNHQHDSPFNYLGKVTLKNRDEGVYGYGVFNDTEAGQQAKALVQHGDVVSLSIFANRLKQSGGNVLHGDIKEVSLVMAGANPGAFIEDVVKHGEFSEDEAYIYTGEEISLVHSGIEDFETVSDKKEDSVVDTKETSEVIEHADENSGGKTVGEVLKTLSDEQLDAVYYIIAEATGASDDDEAEQSDIDEGDEETTMKHNVFEKDVESENNTLSHADQEAIFADAKRYGSLKDSALAHGIDTIDYLFPEPTLLNKPPEFIQRDMGWVSKVMGGVRHTPFSRIKSMFADITEDDARAKGYIKGNLKKEEVFGLLKRTTTPTTIYKKQKLDRDDVVDITDFDVVAWLKTEMRMMLDEELARAFLVGDGRPASSDDKINEQNIRPIWKDEELYTIRVKVPMTGTVTSMQPSDAKAIIRAVIKSRKDYKGSGEPTFYTTENVLTELLLLEDNNGRVIYDSVDKLRTTLRVKEIVTVPIMEGLKNGSDTLIGIIVNLSDYNVGADRGGAVNMFDDFDIDYNAQKYLIETRCSGALIKPYSAIAIEATGASGAAEVG